jgi:hypothetical protein
MHPLTIEYMHMNACLGYVKELLLETISVHPDMTVKFKFALIRSLSKVLCIQNDLISKCYIHEGQEFTDEASNTDNASNTDTTSNMDSCSTMDNASTTNSEVSSVAQDKQGHPSCLIPGFGQSRPNSAEDVRSSRDRSASASVSVDLDRVSSTAEKAVSLDRPSTSGSHPIAYSTSPAFASPFAVGHIHNFETKIWSGGMKQKRGV